MRKNQPLKDKANQENDLKNETAHVAEAPFGKENKVNSAAAKPNPVVHSARLPLSSLTIDTQLIDRVQGHCYGRFARSAAKQGFAIIRLNAVNGQVNSIGQSNFIRVFKPQQDRPLVNASVDFNHAGLSELRAHTPTNNTPMIGDAERSLHFTLLIGEQVEQGVLMPTSPVARRRITKKKFPVFKADFAGSAAVVKRVNESINGDDVATRLTKKKRRCSQNKVMGNQSALSCMQSFASRQQSMLNAQAYQFLNRVRKAEWLHLLAHSLSPLTKDPQQRHNLGAGLARDNTRMMVIENIIKFLSQFIDVAMQVDASFMMVPGSQIIQSIQYVLTIAYQDRTLRLRQFFNVFSHYDYPRQSDQLLLFAVFALLTNQSCQPVSLAQHDTSAAAVLSSASAASNQSQPQPQGGKTKPTNVSGSSKSKRKSTLFTAAPKLAEQGSTKPADNKRTKM